MNFGLQLGHMGSRTIREVKLARDRGMSGCGLSVASAISALAAPRQHPKRRKQSRKPIFRTIFGEQTVVAEGGLLTSRLGLRRTGKIVCSPASFSKHYF